VNAPGAAPTPEGLLLVDKPAGITSHDAVSMVRRALRTRKVGHAGTLDPMATGLLLVGVGRATRLLRFLADLPKTYEGTLHLGVETTTLDAEGDVVREHSVEVSDAELDRAMAALVGDSVQTPPAYSAVKVGGRKLYEAARAGELLEAGARPIHVDVFDRIRRHGRDVDFRVVCGGGTYVRVLAADVGAAVGCGAHLTRLRRTNVGPFSADEARPPGDPGQPLPIRSAVDHLPQVRLDDEETVAARHGRMLGPSGVRGPYGVYDGAGSLVGVYEDDGAKAAPLVILAPS